MTERVVFSFTASLVVVPLLGFLLGFSSYGIRTAPVLAAVSVVTIVLVAIGTFRRNSLPPEDRFEVPLRRWLAPLRTDSVHLGANVLVAVGLVIALSGLGYALATPTDEPFTEFYLATETDSGEYVANGYPRNLTVGETHSITTVTANHGDSARTYTVVVLLQRVRTVEGEITVVEEAAESRSTFRVAAHDVGYNPVAVVPSIRGDDLRLSYLLYVGDPPADPSPENAEHTLYLWVDVAGSEDAGSADLPRR